MKERGRERKRDKETENGECVCENGECVCEREGGGGGGGERDRHRRTDRHRETEIDRQTEDLKPHTKERVAGVC